ncbi:MAG: hypothetical protein E7172_05390 [Firmicutes bacterium]|nr:hypothetical protein [Bacillota bacterium]
MIFLLIDVLIYKYSNLKSYLFLISLNKKDYLEVLGISFVLDFIIFKTYFINIVLLSILYYLKKYFKSYILYNLFNIVIYYIFMNSLFNYLDIYKFLEVIVLNSVFVIVYNRFKRKSFYI